ncbi:MAG: Fe-S cluster assembly ATPase SufC [candidate division Zixibacteria bacterium]|nr:Fe-S cluster assembly ATPase SufC [candidate division Zixibacteria bacterium]MBU1471129.1 Fe-S cluster assembly ATPase SufC [candidate division Zixibacteria bacterium]MBU2625640.1 Fe-S cluster assembly ATPase SufC [candidate division Zixibacteria bacterium]
MNKNNAVFSLRDIHVRVEDKEVVKGVTLDINPGEKHAIMGPNGSGKSSLANALAGHPSYEITSGEAYIGGRNLLDMDSTDRSLAGLFLAFQYPMAIPGVTVSNFLRAAVKARANGDETVLKNFRKELKKKFELLEVDQSFATRYINEGFSGGEKKRLEILQLSMLDPKIAILDETDSGLDIDALKIVSAGINAYANDTNGILLVTHYQRILDYVKPDRVHVMMNGRFVHSGGADLALQLEKEGYDWLKESSDQKVGV